MLPPLSLPAKHAAALQSPWLEKDRSSSGPPHLQNSGSTKEDECLPGLGYRHSQRRKSMARAHCTSFSSMTHLATLPYCTRISVSG
ncbi:hypothetical protein Y1Q_0015887 [Alligator mississippiensis]|uniref:Uncharacterized protein n=1 Tax=Alligator mississippiensis TaxID=8496 RepID=A0A151MHB1_ALLMI|nr:hypothetical protein Y1Q_0015887 [Alligator mississippiensis]